MARHLFDESQYDWSTPVDSYWETGRAALPAVEARAIAGDETADVAIIGGGYCGLSAAYHLAREDVDVRVLEAGPIGWGASGRNGGFCSVGGTWLGPVELKAAYGEAETFAFYRALVEAVRLVEHIANEEKLELERQGGGVWTFAHKPSRMKELKTQADLLAHIGVPSRIVATEALPSEAFASPQQFGALHESVGFGLNPLAYCVTLARATAARGAKLHPHSRVTKWTREGAMHRLVTAVGSVKAQRVIVAANGWLPEELVPELAGRVLPLLSNINVTRPLTVEELRRQSWKTEAPASNTRALLAYLRLLPDKRLLVGGRGDTTGKTAGGLAMRRLLERRMGQIFPAFRGVEITHSWRGFIAATTRLTPAIGELPSDATVSFAFGCHGNGVALMTWAGRELARRITDTERALPAPFHGLPPRFPLASLRRWQLKALLARAYFEDAFL